MKRPWMPIYWADYLADTAHLSTAQHGAYLLLMGHYWRHGDLPDDDDQLARITRLPLTEWLADRDVLHRFFFDGWKHKRIEHELKRHAEVHAQRLAASEKGNFTRQMNRFRRH